MSDVRSALIVGGGIGGLAMALALRKVGIEARVLEQAPVLREVGAGIALWPNAMRTLDALGVGRAVHDSTHAVRWLLGKNARGDELTRLDAAALLGDMALGPRVVHRGELLQILAAAVGSDTVRTGARVTAARTHGDGASVTLESGEELRADVVVGADGLHSRVRPVVVDDAPRPAGQACYRGIVSMAVEEPDTMMEIQGRGLRCALCPLGPERLYWWAVEDARGAEDVAVGARKARVLERFATFPSSFVRAVEHTPADAILHNLLFDRAPVTRWHAGRVVLLGDAAHPTTPNLGQGANMALDDALVLARALRDEPNVEAAFARYERERVARAAHIVTLSRRFGAVAAWSNPAAVALRELGLRMMPQRMLEQEVRAQIEEDVGAL